MTPSQIGLAIKIARVSRRMSARQLAAQIGFTSPILSHIESGKRSVSLAEAYQICSALSMRLDDLVTIAKEVDSKDIVVDSKKDKVI